MGLKKDTMTFEESFGKEIFLICGDVDVAEELFVFGEWGDLDVYLKSQPVSQYNAPRVLHGVITPATFLPNSIMGRPVHLICSEDGFETGYVIELSASNANELSLEVEVAVNGNISGCYKTEIEDIFLFYGYEVPTSYTVDEESIDDEIIHTCLRIAEEAKKVEKVVMEAQ